MVSDVFNQDKTFESSSEFLEVMSRNHNLTGNHTRVIFQTEYWEGFNLREGVKNAVLNLVQPAEPFSTIFGYKGVEFDLESYLVVDFKENLTRLKQDTKNRFENYETEIGCRYLHDNSTGNYIYTFYMSFLLDTEDNFKIKAFSFNACVDCVWHYEDSKWMLYHDEVSDFPEGFIAYEPEVFNQLMVMSLDYWDSLLKGLLISLGIEVMQDGIDRMQFRNVNLLFAEEL